MPDSPVGLITAGRQEGGDVFCLSKTFHAFVNMLVREETDTQEMESTDGDAVHATALLVLEFLVCFVEEGCAQSYACAACKQLTLLQ